MYPRTAFTDQATFDAEVARAARRLLPDVVSISVTLEQDWSGEPAVFFTVVFSDTAAHDQLFEISKRVSDIIDQEVQPIEKWGVFPYFSFRTEAEQAQLNQLALA